ncbi:MAG: UDP-N-acetylglucosamine 2-epimerase [Planctomycetota bacterium]
MSLPRTIAVVTGTRADFGLLRPVLAAIMEHPGLELRLAVTGTHLLPPADTAEEVRRAFPVAVEIPMQRPAAVGRIADAEALGRGVSGFAAWLGARPSDWLMVLGDRIEALAAASAAAIGGTRVAHIHGGDRAEGVSDEGIRHAITKLSHLHFAATARSAERLLCLGEPAGRVRLVGSPAIDELASIPPLEEAAWDELGRPRILMLLHPTGEADVVEEARCDLLLDRCLAEGPVLALDPNHDPGRDGIVRSLQRRAGTPGFIHRTHLDRRRFIGALRRVRVLAGNSSAGRIEAAAIPVRVVDVGPRQAGRECPRHVLHVPGWDEGSLAAALERAIHEPIPPFRHPYGDGHTGRRIAAALAEVDPLAVPLAKRNSF